MEWNEMVGLTRMSVTYSMVLQWRASEGHGALMHVGDRIWHPTVLEVPEGASGSVELRLTPLQVAYYLRNIRFESGGKVIPARPLERSGAFVDVATDGDARVLTFGEQEHFSIPIPPGIGACKLCFDVQCAMSRRATFQLTDRLTKERTAPRPGTFNPSTLRLGR